MMNVLERLISERAALLVVDIQEKLLPAIESGEACLAASRKLIGAARVLGIPTLVTEQYPAGLGRTVPAIADALGDFQAFDKMCFTACVESVRNRLRELGREQVLVCGIEAHVCVQQTVLDLLREGFSVCLCADAVGSRRALDREIAVQRMRQAGAVVTTAESAIFEMLQEAGTDRFKQVLRIIK